MPLSIGVIVDHLDRGAPRHFCDGRHHAPLGQVDPALLDDATGSSGDPIGQNRDLVRPEVCNGNEPFGRSFRVAHDYSCNHNHVCLQLNGNSNVDPFPNYEVHIMADLFDNPMGLCGFDFVEFTAPEKGFWNRFSRASG